jgi:uncharacterized cupredoxin-like copper-binding protein
MIRALRASGSRDAKFAKGVEVMSFSRLSSLVGAALILGVLLTACGGASTANLSVVTTDFAFTPTDATVAAGQEVSLTLTNNGSVEHEWVLMEAGYQVTTPFDDDDEPHVYWEGEVDAGESMTFTFTAPSEPGDYPIVCGVAGHLEAGMVGTLTVTE